MACNASTPALLCCLHDFHRQIADDGNGGLYLGTTRSSSELEEVRQQVQACTTAQQLLDLKERLAKYYVSLRQVTLHCIIAGRLYEGVRAEHRTTAWLSVRWWHACSVGCNMHQCEAPMASGSLQCRSSQSTPDIHYCTSNGGIVARAE